MTSLCSTCQNARGKNHHCTLRTSNYLRFHKCGGYQRIDALHQLFLEVDLALCKTIGAKQHV